MPTGYDNNIGYQEPMLPDSVAICQEYSVPSTIDDPGVIAEFMHYFIIRGVKIRGSFFNRTGAQG